MTVSQPVPPAERPADGAPAISVEGLTLRAGKRTIFEDVTFDVPAGSLAVLAGPSGTGKSPLALALAGRLTPTAGRASVGGLALPRHAREVRRRVAVTGNATVTPLDETLTVKHHVAEALQLAGPWWRRSATPERVDRTITAANDLLGALEDVFGDDDASDPLVRARLHRRELVRDAAPAARFALGLVLALVSDPDILVVDDVDQLRTVRERRAAWAALLTLGRMRDDARPLTVVATCQDRQELTDVLDAGHRLGALPLRPVIIHALGASSAPTPAPEIR
ncbi:ATP-binding cassette domain-containing protein [Arthrobacter agilis]|uniref:ATP-binding cassette domain-containing protein n=1 Tax=Arthrobacter agilis TaxID=37921 RepID=UPI0027865FFD|nr:ATP-binding cassette domain-containing protein [Arthrobacter agilis]MDQ0733666.1 ABC-2 type transport system ATP-binding protein [Arthrobacter agilis]